MSLEERKESVISKLASIDKQRSITDKEFEKSWAADRENEAKQKEAEANKNALIEKNWNELKPLILDSLKNINESVLKNTGKLIEWKRSNEAHKHKFKTYSQDENDYFDREEEHLLDLEFSGLKVKDNTIFIERIFSSCDHYGKYDFNEKNPNEFYIYYGNIPDFDKESKKFSLILDKSNIQPLVNSVEDSVLDLIVATY